jgi:protein TonB
LYRLEWALLAESPAWQHGSYRYRPSLGGRLSAIALALAVCALILLILIRMGLIAPGPGGIAERLTAITFRPQGVEHSNKPAVAKAAERHERKTVAQPRPTPPVQPNPVPKRPAPVPWIQLSRDEFAASDISRMAKHPTEASSNGLSGAKSYGPGEGPGGATLYNAEWYREPTHAEMVTYLPHRDVTGGWAMIACKTQENYHVDDCQELGESPAGSGLARALRQAAWQFLVRPPRLEGKPLIGAWVRIRFDFTAPKARDTDNMTDATPGGDAN